MRNGSNRRKQPVERKQKRRKMVLRKLKPPKRVVDRRKLSVECVIYAFVKGSSLLILEIITSNTYFCSAPRNEGGGVNNLPPLS